MKLLNCPFCGGIAKVRSQGFNTNSIVCDSCHARTASHGGMGAAKKWNARDCELLAQKEIHRLEEVAEYQRKLDLAMAVIENLRLTAENCGKLTEEMTDMIDGVKNEI